MDKRTFFNNLASEWDLRVPDQQKLRRALSLITVNKGELVGDIGCGTGILLPYLYDAVGLTGNIICIDFAHKMLVNARRKFREETIHYVTADGEKLSIRNACFDSLVCFAVFAHFRDQASALKECSRVLKPGGRLFIFHLLESLELKAIHAKAGGPIESDILPSQEELSTMFNNSGFSQVSIMDEYGLFFACAVKI